MQRFKALRTVLRLGSFTKAAHALGYTQSSISQMMASLEEELSFKLPDPFQKWHYPYPRRAATLPLFGTGPP